MDREIGAAYIRPNHSPWYKMLTYLQFVSMKEKNRRIGRKSPCTTRVLKTLSIYALADLDTITTHVHVYTLHIILQNGNLHYLACLWIKRYL